jgi:hypothetical protein
MRLTKVLLSFARLATGEVLGRIATFALFAYVSRYFGVRTSYFVRCCLFLSREAVVPAPLFRGFRVRSLGCLGRDHWWLASNEDASGSSEPHERNGQMAWQEEIARGHL